MTSLTELFKREPFQVLRSYESGQDFSILVDCTLKRDILDPEVVVAGIEFWECFITLEGVSYKEEFRKLSEDERTSIGSENQKFLRDFDNETLQMEFHHLPQKPSRMEFHLVSIIAAVYPSF